MKNPVVTVLSLLRTVRKKVLGLDKKKLAHIPEKKPSNTNLKKKGWHWFKKRKELQRRNRGRHGHGRHD